LAQVRRNKKLANNKFPEFKRETINFLGLLFSVLFLLSIYSHDPNDPSFLNSGLASHVNNYIGIVGAYVSFFVFQFFGQVSYLLPILFIYLLIKRHKSQENQTTIRKLVNNSILLLCLLALCGLVTIAYPLTSADGLFSDVYGGYIGLIISQYLSSYISYTGSAIVLTLIFFFTAVNYFNIPVKRIYVQTKIISEYIYLKLKFNLMTTREKISLYMEKSRELKKTDQVLSESTHESIEVEKPEHKKHTSKREFKEKQQELFSSLKKPELPLLELLIQHSTETTSYDDASLELMSRMLESNLNDFGIEVQVISVKPGPVVTLFEIKPAKGIKVSQITNLSKDLARTMSVTSLRVVDNIPGTSSIGIEIPNESREMVSLREIIISKEYEKSKSPLTIALGKDIQGNPICSDLQKLPHLLVAGTTGSGKSVTLHTMIVSLLYKSDPSDLKMLFVDPKMLELSAYDEIPHLLNPVITDMNDASAGLRWCVQQMEKRYRLMNDLGVRDIKSYNKLLSEKESKVSQSDSEINHEKLPFIVVVIDEFADMMLVVGKKVEDLIIRLAQKARAAGIHLILATQRPSVNVITGLIKANIPARAALQVTTNIDSRTIIDSMGAENLLGNGDMLFMSPGSRIPKRIHGAYVSDEEIKNIVNFLKKGNESSYIESLLESLDDEDSNMDESDDDPLYQEALKIVMETRKTSISFIQRKLRIGYNRAANLIETMETRGVLSSQQSNGSREILNPK
tara:strand:- start:2925 stop:5144 length:2220 start_codon:yes stop_codon:yes gene_type:complete